MKITEMKFEAGGPEYHWVSDHDGKGGDLYSSAGSSLASLELVKADKPSPGLSRRKRLYWVVRNFDGYRKRSKEGGGYEYVHDQLGKPLCASRIKVGDALAMAAHTLVLFRRHGWTGQRKKS